ncbi:hypothetical protein BV25DRAFT_1830577 [Artomyces pyxidatus]|uniref:Uncharacterized protein n=1 Tax=Artomyces pyxidatus TaxID=48021 RepID=A0ACB8SNS9_9AGAM|nr:hypothetical protein BV25DRAFT_1830577 [Artomyces pyxidatus]
MSYSPTSSVSDLESDEQYIIRPLTSADVIKVRALHAKLSPSSKPLRSTFFTQLLTHPARLCLIATTLSAPADPVAVITAALSVRTTDLGAGAGAFPLEVRVLTLGVLPAHRRHHLASRLLHAAVEDLCAHAKTGSHSAPAYVSAEAGSLDDAGRAFWKGVGLHEAEPWRQGWADVVRVEGRVAIEA